MRQLTVRQLHTLLGRAMEKLGLGDELVEVEGCDCIGACLGFTVRADQSGSSVVLRRGDPKTDDYGEPLPDGEMRAGGPLYNEDVITG